MKTLALIFALLALAVPTLSADEDTPVPPEIQKLFESFFAAFKSGDEAALTACWHTPEQLAKERGGQVAKDAAISPTPVDAAKEQEKELKRQTKNMSVTLRRAAQMRQIISKHFGDLSQLTLTRLEIDEDEEAVDTPAYDSIEIRFRAADGTALKVEIDSVVQLEGAWKLKGRLEDDLTIELPEE